MASMQQKRLLLFGASGAIGGAIGRYFAKRDWVLVGASREVQDKLDAVNLWIHCDTSGAIDEAALRAAGPVHAVCWAQGANANDSVYTVDEERHLDMYRANCLFILITLKRLLASHLLMPSARLCVISSIWQNLARQDKLSYCMTKSALQGLILSAATDLAREGYLINAVLPGVLDTPMTHNNLTAKQVAHLETSTNFGRLPQLDDVASLVYFLCSDENTGVTGQFIAADLGFSRVRLV